MWEEYAAGTCVRFCGCTPVNGRLHPLDAGHVYLRSKSALHQTEPWEGDRLILIAYQCRPTSHSTSSPPLAVQYPVPSQLEEFLAKARSRVSGKPLHQLMFVEVFAGTAGFCAAVRRQGLHRSVGVDHQAPRNVQAPLVVLDLTNTGQRTLLLQMLQNPDVVACHLAPPCGTSSLARNIPNGGPPPLRSPQHPDGLPGISGVQRTRVLQANKLYALTCEVALLCMSLGILCCIENPARSLFWLCTSMAARMRLPMLSTSLHHCMVGSQRRKATRLLHSIPQMQALQLTCDNKHTHEPWGKMSDGSWATKAECAYPRPMCNLMATAVVEQLLILGASPCAQALSDASVSLHRESQVATSKQPRGKRLPPLVPEYRLCVSLTGPLSDTPVLSNRRTTADFHVPRNVHCAPHVACVPSQSKCVRVSSKAGNSPEHSAHVSEMVLGIPWCPADFVKRACGVSHPRSVFSGVPQALRECIEHCTSNDPVSVGRDRTAMLRKWVLRAKELKDEWQMPDHCRKILAGKSMPLFEEMLAESGYQDKGLPGDIAKGFDLLGAIPSSGVLPKKSTFATLSTTDVRSVAAANQKAALDAVSYQSDPTVAEEGYKLTLEEVERGWMRGPLPTSVLPEGSILTKRFGVVQSCADANAGSIKKVRPIDDFTASLANLTSSCDETIEPHGVDTILAGIMLRSRLHRKRGGTGKFLARTIDLRKAYKQLPLSLEALPDAYICVWNPWQSRAELFQSLVLRFGAKLRFRVSVGPPPPYGS